MATYVQRATAIADALLNSTATIAQKKRIAKAFTPSLDDTATGPEIAEAFVRAIREYVLDRVGQYESQAAMVAARVATVDSVGADFSEVP